MYMMRIDGYKETQLALILACIFVVPTLAKAQPVVESSFTVPVISTRPKTHLAWSIADGTQGEDEGGGDRLITDRPHFS